MLHVKYESENVIQILQNSLKPHTHLILKIFLDTQTNLGITTRQCSHRYENLTKTHQKNVKNKVMSKSRVVLIHFLLSIAGKDGRFKERFLTIRSEEKHKTQNLDGYYTNGLCLY